MPPIQDTAHFIVVEFVGGPRDGELAVYGLHAGSTADAPRVITIPMLSPRGMMLYDPTTDPEPDRPVFVGEYHQRSCVVNTVTAVVACMPLAAELLDILAAKGEPSIYEWHGEF